MADACIVCLGDMRSIQADISDTTDHPPSPRQAIPIMYVPFPPWFTFTLQMRALRHWLALSGSMRLHLAPKSIKTWRPAGRTEKVKSHLLVNAPSPSRPRRDVLDMSSR